MDTHKAKLYFWIVLDIFIASLALAVIFAVVPAVKRYGNSLAPTRIITVTAEGKTTVTPDIAEASFTVLSQGKNPEELADVNNSKMASVIQFVKSQGVDDKDIKTTNYNLAPDYEYEEKIRRRFIVGFTLAQTIHIKMRDFDNVAKIIAGLIPLGVNQIGGINFSVEDPEKFLAVARSQAIESAKAKASEMASQSGARLGRVLSLSESGVVPPLPRYFRAEALGAPAAVAVAEPTIEPGTQEITSRVTLTYELR